MKNKYYWKLGVLCVVVIVGIWVFKNLNLNFKYEVGQSVDSLNGITVFYNGGVNNRPLRKVENMLECMNEKQKYLRSL